MCDTVIDIIEKLQSWNGGENQSRRTFYECFHQVMGNAPVTALSEACEQEYWVAATEKNGSASEPEPTVTTESDLERFALVMGDSISTRIAVIADSKRPAGERMLEIMRLDGRYIAFKSPKWATLLKVSASRIRQICDKDPDVIALREKHLRKG
jgi:hypothetical protein